MCKASVDWLAHLFVLIFVSACYKCFSVTWCISALMKKLTSVNTSQLPCVWHFHLCTDTNLTGWWWLIWTTEHRACHSLGVAWYFHWTFKQQYGFLQELATLFPSIELFEKEMSLWLNSSQPHLHSVLIPLPYTSSNWNIILAIERLPKILCP